MDVCAEVEVQIRPHQWQRGQVIDRYENPIEASAVIVVKFEDGSVLERAVPMDVTQEAADVRLFTPERSQHLDVDDLTQLIELDETTILSALENRFLQQKIYTNTGTILLAVNPFQKIASVYSKDTMANYLLSFEAKSSNMKSKSSKSMPPHIYQVAGEAYKAMMLGLNGVMSDQSILVSGESGSGKTESTKFLMEYLAQAGASNLGATVVGKGPGGIAAKVLQTNILLESFGNARTLRNDNSSRFGKFIKLHFTSGGRLTGASIQTYLLEKVRLASQSKGERNYHIFYEMAIGAAPAARKRWFLDPPKGHAMSPGDYGEVTEATRQFLHYRYLNRSECYQRRDGVKDSDMFKRVMEAMNIVGFTPAERTGIFDTLAALMHIGNLSFDYDENNEKLGNPGTDKSDLTPSCIWSRDAAATLMAVDATKLEHALSVRRIRAGTDFVSVKLSAAQANNARDALAKALYGRLFDWMVTKINHFLRMDDSQKAKGGLHFIGILDIFGFEVFPKNSFEQLCINFANETLQQQFNDYVFKAEQREYESQGVDWKYIEFCDNQDCVNLISQRPTGILSLIDDECVMPKGSDTTLASKLYRACGSHSRFEASRIQRARGLFTIVHYAGHVEYSSDGFLEKNKDVLHQEAVDMLVYSTREDSFARTLCEGIGGSHDRAKSSPRQRAQTSKHRGASVGLQFKEQLTTLLETLHQTNPHYVRCLKPNELCKAGTYERERVLNQLRCNGVMEAVRVARAGYPIRLPHDEFVARYFSLKRSDNPLLAKKQIASFGDTKSHEGMTVISCEAKELLKGLLDVIPKENGANPQGACEQPDQGPFAAKCISVGIQMGLTKMFMKKPTYELLEEMRSQRLRRHMIKIFYTVLCVIARTRYLKYLHATTTLQIRFRYKKRQKLRRRRQIVMIRRKNGRKVQGFVRTAVQRKKYVRFISAVRTLQCRFRYRRMLRLKRMKAAARAKTRADLQRAQQAQAQVVNQYIESSTASSNSSSSRSVTSNSNDIEGSSVSDMSGYSSEDQFAYNENFPKHNLNTVDEQSSQLMPHESHRTSLRKSQSIDLITPMGGIRGSRVIGDVTGNVHRTTSHFRSRMSSRKSSFRNTRSSRVVALPRLDVIQHTSWVNDEDRFSCHICNKRFNVFKRKHHCRACGEVICNSCSLYHRIQSRSMRVCVSCVAFHSLDSPTSGGSAGLLRAGSNSVHSTNSSRKTSSGSTADRNRSSTLSSGMWLNAWPEPPYPVDEDERLTVLRELNIRDLGSSGKFNMYCEVAAKTMKCPIAYVSIIEDEEQHLVANIGMAHTTLPRELSFCAHTICQPSVLVVLDTKNDDRFRENPMVKGDKGAVKIRYYAGATIFSRDGHALGTVAVLDTKPRREVDQEHIGMLQHLSFLASEKMTQSNLQGDSDSEFL